MFPLPPRLSRYILLALFFIVSLTLLLGGKLRPTLRLEAPSLSILANELASLEQQDASTTQSQTKPARNFAPGLPVPGYNYTRTIVVPRKKSEDLSWLEDELPGVQRAVYVVDDARAVLKVPRNKGNEAMVYLTYIIDHYDVLPDVSIFIHAHRWAWHNNDLLDADTALMIRYLSSARVIREGYVNLRCQWFPGCPGWLHPNAEQEDEEKKEEMYIALAWGDLFPREAMPEVLGQPCCSQFAVSRDRIRAVGLGEYKRLREWLLKTTIRDSMSGRIFEYTWQYLYTGEAVLCVSTHACYCDGYGACFEDEAAFQEWFKMRFEVRQDEWELEGWEENERVWREKGGEVERAPKGRVEGLKLGINQRWIELFSGREKALERGLDPQLRARIAGRVWHEGDGF